MIPDKMEIPMPMLTLYPELPAIFKWQAIAFIRMEWLCIFQGDNLNMPETYPPEFDPIHFVGAQCETLLSYATLLKLNQAHGGLDYCMCAFGIE